jgi:hypothetical protein
MVSQMPACLEVRAHHNPAFFDYLNFGSHSCSALQSHQPRMLYKITVLGDGGVGKTALTVQVRSRCTQLSGASTLIVHQFTMSSFVEVGLQNDSGS